MNILCKIIGHKTIQDNPEDDWLVGAKHCTRNNCTYKVPALVYPKPPPYKPIKRKQMKFNKEQIAQIFNEWNKRYSKDPKNFTESLDESGQPKGDYGEDCAVYFQKLSDELISAEIKECF